MGTKLEVATVMTGRWPNRRGALHLGVESTRKVLQGAGLTPDKVDLLINAGLYHDRNLGEPALAPLIQADAGINPGDPAPGHSACFSFDVANGACGVLNALQIADGFLQAGTANTAVVVAEDATPGHRLAPDFPFSSAGGALLCSTSDDIAGLGAVAWHHSDQPDDSFEAKVSFDGGHNRLTIQEAPAFAARAADAAVLVIEQALAAASCDPAAVDFVVTGFSDPVILEALTDRAGLAKSRIVRPQAGLHTVALIDAIAGALTCGKVRPGDKVLMVSVGAGIVSGAALYFP